MATRIAQFPQIWRRHIVPPPICYVTTITNSRLLANPLSSRISGTGRCRTDEFCGGSQGAEGHAKKERACPCRRQSLDRDHLVFIDETWPSPIWRAARGLVAVSAGAAEICERSRPGDGMGAEYVQCSKSPVWVMLRKIERVSPCPLSTGMRLLAGRSLAPPVSAEQFYARRRPHALPLDRKSVV